jgi:subtilisin
MRPHQHCLGGGPKDEATHSAIADAGAKGALVIAASGNDGRAPVSFPAADSLALAVSALGRKGTFPAGTTETGDAAAPYGKDKANFIAAFSNVGPEISLTGPGVGIISTFPNNKYAVMDGSDQRSGGQDIARAQATRRQKNELLHSRPHEGM